MKTEDDVMGHRLCLCIHAGNHAACWTSRVAMYGP
jgi:hypothetical protein